MKRRMIEALKRLEAGRSADEVGRSYGVSRHTVYAWKAKYGGMDVSEAQEVKSSTRGKCAAQEAGGGPKSGQRRAAIGDPKKPLGLVARRAEVQRLTQEFEFSQRHACELVEIPRSTHRYRGRKDDGALRERLLALAHEQPRYGYRRLCVLLNDGGAVVNHKRVQRVYRAAGLQVKRIRRRRLSRSAVPRVNLTAANQEWALDFASDVTSRGRRIRVLGVIDAFTRECLAPELDTSFPSRRLTRVLETVIAQRGKPASLRSDNGPEMTSPHYLAWCIEQKITAVHIQPGRPMQNGHVESFNACATSV